MEGDNIRILDNCVFRPNGLESENRPCGQFLETDIRTK